MEMIDAFENYEITLNATDAIASAIAKLSEKNREVITKRLMDYAIFCTTNEDHFNTYMAASMVVRCLPSGDRRLAAMLLVDLVRRLVEKDFDRDEWFSLEDVAGYAAGYQEDLTESINDVADRYLARANAILNGKPTSAMLQHSEAEKAYYREISLQRLSGD